MSPYLLELATLMAVFSVVIVVPGADHFFHRKLGHIKNFVTQLWRRP